MLYWTYMVNNANNLVFCGSENHECNRFCNITSEVNIQINVLSISLLLTILMPDPLFVPMSPFILTLIYTIFEKLLDANRGPSH